MFVKYKSNVQLNKKFTEIIDEPEVILVNEFTEKSAKEFREGMKKAHNTGQDIIPVVIDSYGGYVHSLISMIDTIEESSLPVATIAIGKAMSCGAMLLGHGTQGYRFSSPNARIMIHDVSAMSIGKVAELKSSTKESEFLHNYIFESLAKHIGKKDKNFFEKELDKRKHAEWYLGAQEAKDLNLVNEIKIPNFEVNINVKYNFNI